VIVRVVDRRGELHIRKVGIWPGSSCWADGPAVGRDGCGAGLVVIIRSQQFPPSGTDISDTHEGVRQNLMLDTEVVLQHVGCGGNVGCCYERKRPSKS